MSFQLQDISRAVIVKDDGNARSYLVIPLVPKFFRGENDPPIKYRDLPSG